VVFWKKLSRSGLLNTVLGTTELKTKLGGVEGLLSCSLSLKLEPEMIVFFPCDKSDRNFRCAYKWPCSAADSTIVSRLAVDAGSGGGAEQGFAPKAGSRPLVSMTNIPNCVLPLLFLGHLSLCRYN
jgi:hypothetical protein